MSGRYVLMLWKPPPVNERRPWRGYRTRERRDEMAQAFARHGWHVVTRDPNGAMNSLGPVEPVP